MVSAADRVAEILKKHEKDLTMVDNPEFRGHCETCENPVIGADGVSYKVDSLTRFFHKACFKCSACQSSLKDGPTEEFFIHNGTPHCVSCYQSRVLGYCDTCSTVLTQTGVVRTKNRKFHPECFICKQCSDKLDGRYYEKDSAFWCRTCYIDIYIPKCEKCTKKILPQAEGQPITSIDWKGKKYHQECFGCTDCEKIFMDLKAFQIDGNLFCKNCHSIRTKTAPPE